MSIDIEDVRSLCTDAVFERGEQYYEDGRVRDIARFDDVITAFVEGSRTYELHLDLSAEAFDPACDCPYDGPGTCKHVVAVLLSLAEGLPPDEGDRIETVLEVADPDQLRTFLREELIRDDRLRERFLARFDRPPVKSVETYREGVEGLFEEHTRDSPFVVEAIDFSRFTELAGTYLETGNEREAAKVYRGLVRGIEDNMERVDAAYDHYEQEFRAALDGYVESVLAAEMSGGEWEIAVEFLAERAETAPRYLRDPYREALEELTRRSAG